MTKKNKKIIYAIIGIIILIAIIIIVAIISNKPMVIDNCYNCNN